MKKVVVIGGGTGTYNVLKGLKNFYLDLTAVVTMADDGGSTGRLIDEYGVLPPGDIRRCLVALSNSDETMKKLFQYRFEKGSLSGHSFGNIFLTSLKEVLGNDYLAIKEAGKILKVRGTVLPVTLNKVRLCAELEDGQLIVGETNIDVPKHNPNLKIKKVFLTPRATANEEVLKKIEEADMIVIGPGDLYTSVIPNILAEKLPEAIKNSKAKKVYVCNLMTKHGETDGFFVSDFVSELEKYLGKDILDFVLYNSSSHDKKLLKKYKSEKAFPVLEDKQKFNNFKAEFIQKKVSAEKSLVRHDSEKLARALVEIIS